MTALSDFPRPENDTGIGFHYYADARHYDREALRFWLPELESLGASWLVLYSEPAEPVPEGFLRELVAHGIEPVVRVVSRPIGLLDPLGLAKLAGTYAACGVRYCSVYVEPNVATNWGAVEWARPDLVGRFVEILLPALRALRSAGLWPLLPALRPGGDYWDTAFLGTMLRLLCDRAEPDLLESLGICIHIPTGNRPLRWGRGGPRAWPLARPYYTPPGTQDHRGFHLFEWYDEIVRAKLGRSLPMIVGEGGPVVGDSNDPDYPVLDEITHSMRVAEIARTFVDGDVPDYLFNYAFFALGQGVNDANDLHAWYKSDGRRLPAVAALKLLKNQGRLRRRATPTNAARSSSEPERHYLLFLASPDGDGPDGWSTEALLQSAAAYVARFRPSVGFSIAEASAAQRVTIVAAPGMDGSAAERLLARDGRIVERIDISSVEEAKRILDELARSGRRFVHH